MHVSLDSINGFMSRIFLICLIFYLDKQLLIAFLQLMMDVMPNEEGLMPHRNSSNSSAATQAEPAVNSSQATLPTTPIRKLSRNRGRVVQEQSIQQESSDSDNDSDPTRANASRRCKRKLN